MRMDSQIGVAIGAILLIVLSTAAPAAAQESPPESPPPAAFQFLRPPSPTGQSSPTTVAPSSPLAPAGLNLPDLTKRETFSSAMQLIILLTVLSLAPAILIMMT